MARLDAEQEQLLVTLVELVRSVPRPERRSFLLLEMNGGDFILMPGAQQQPMVNSSDLRELVYAGLLRQAPGGSRHSTPFDITRAGYDHYEELMRSAEQPTEAVEEEVGRYLDSAAFSDRHPDSYAKWRQAEELVWGDDSERHMTAVGHHLREALMAFATEAVVRYEVTDANPDPERTIDRLRAVVAKAKPRLGDTETPMLDALIVYWGTIHDLAARQEHGAAKEALLVAEDARRVVFQSAMVMFELDRAFVRAFGK